jgi:hypothetical protein
MKRASSHHWLGYACMLAAVTAGGQAAALQRVLVLDPPKGATGAISFGFGYDTQTGFKSQRCIDFDASKNIPDRDSATGEDKGKFTRILRKEDIFDESSSTTANSGGFSLLGFSAKASQKSEVVNSAKVNLSSETISAWSRRLEGTEFIDPATARISEALRSHVSNGRLAPTFRNRCGNYVVTGILRGRELIAMGQIKIKDVATSSKVSNAFGLEGSAWGFSAKSDTSLVNSLKKSTNDSQWQFTYYAVPQLPGAIASLDQLYKAYDTFGKEARTQVVKYVVQPYEDVLTELNDVPLEDDTTEDKLATLGRVAFVLKSLQDSVAAFVENESGRGPKLFALGSTAQTRAARLKQLTEHKSKWEKDLDRLRADAKGCDEKWSPRCETAYATWSKLDEAAEYAKIAVERYTSACGFGQKPVTLADDLLAAHLGSLGKLETLSVANKRADNEMGGGPVLLAFALRFKPEKRALKAILDVYMEEDKKDRTAFEGRTIVKVLDLDGRAEIGLFDGDLSQCRFKGDGVANKLVRFNGVGPKKKLAGEYHGVVAYRTESNARQVAITKGLQGALTKVVCTVDEGAGNDLPYVGCPGKPKPDGANANNLVTENWLGIRSITLDLVNAQDLEADKLVKPPVDRVRKLFARTAAKAKPKEAKACKANMRRVKSRNGGSLCVPIKRTRRA